MNNFSRSDIKLNIEDVSGKTKEVLNITNLSLKWVENNNFSSYDWWDIWGTSFGSWAKGMYFKAKIIGIPFVAILVLLDLIYPNFRKLFVKKRTFPICHAHLGMAYLNLYEKFSSEEYLKKSESFVPELLKMASPYAKDLGWGMKHQWMTIQGLVPVDTPCNTQTSYGYEFFSRLYEITNKDEYKVYLEKIAKHVANDFPEWQVDDDKLVCSYSTIDKRRVVNANSYRMYMLIDAGIRFNNEFYLKKGLDTMRYVISKQNNDGSWPYSEDQDFVDCYHTCFVLKNLNKVRKILGEEYKSLLDSVIDKGLKYYLKNLFDENKYPIPFAIQPRTTIFKYDSYDLAESIALLSELDIEHELIEKLVQFSKNTFQTKEGWFKFRIYKVLPIIGIPYMRYSNSAMIFALTKVLKVKFNG
ncbi:MAG: hypothetical protein U0457_16975 [Candidatus Sericytochromatia bacterium]